MMSSCCTLRLNRRKALSKGSPSVTWTSAMYLIHPLPGEWLPRAPSELRTQCPPSSYRLQLNHSLACVRVSGSACRVALDRQSEDRLNIAGANRVRRSPRHYQSQSSSREARNARVNSQWQSAREFASRPAGATEQKWSDRSEPVGRRLRNREESQGMRSVVTEAGTPDSSELAAATARRSNPLGYDWGDSLRAQDN